MSENPAASPETGGETPGAGTSTAAPESVIKNLNVDKLNLLKDVEIPLSVEIGRTELAVRDILDLERGSIITLDKESEEPMDIRVNGRLIARGEIGVVKENFGIRITEIIDADGALT